MKQINCHQENAVLRSARTGQWNEPLKAHVAGCAHCREIADTTRWMLSMAELPEFAREGSAALPEPGLLWWKAQLAQKQRASERARRRLDWMESAMPAAIVLAVAGAFALFWPQVQAQFPVLLNELWPQLSEAASAASPLPAVYSSLAIPVIFAVCAIAIFVAYPFLVED